VSEMGPTTTLGELASAAGDALVSIEGAATSVGDVSYDSRSVSPGGLFFCVPGLATDGHRFAPDAVAAGASAVVVERRLDVSVPQVMVSDVRVAMARMSAAFFGNPAAGLLMLGVTGTNGKTTTVFLLDSILRAAGHTTGVIGTIETRMAGSTRPGVRTTPESIDLHRLFAEMRSAGVDAVVMEVTSHGLVLKRVEGVLFAASGFTNLSQDHLDFHESMEAYFAAKRVLFTHEHSRAGAVNLDDPYGRKLLDVGDIPCVGFGTGPDAQIRGSDVVLEASRSRMRISMDPGSFEVTTRLVGHFNVSNCLAAAAIAHQAGIPVEDIRTGIESCASVPGRFESVDEGQPFTVVVDYAHTPDSLDNVLRAARPLADANGGRVLVAFGCGGDRDRGKRPLMGGVAARLADVVVVTSDNPRSEEPDAIIGEILEGVDAERSEGPDAVLPDRREAIAWILKSASGGDVVVIAGKGHETGQTFADRTIPFDDRDVARDELRALGFGVAR
jgi:UDP-N-acetylmuramoyl-L-alanyl-D-glutamate--2,6-diaminopimelate ligase